MTAVDLFDASITVTALAADLGVDAGDVRVILAEHDLQPDQGDVLTQAEAVEVRAVLDPDNERTVPELFGLAAVDWRDHADDPL